MSMQEDCSRPKNKWIKSARPRRSVDRWTKIQDPRSNHHTGAQVGDAEGLFKSPWIKKQDPRSNHHTDAQVGDAEGLFKSLWRIIILQPQVNLSICLSL